MVKPGYKQTEVGVIPDEWSLAALSELGTFSKGKGIKKTDVVENGLPCIRYGELYTHHNDIIRKFYSNISYEIAMGSVRLKTGDILFAGSGETAEEIGKCAAFLGEEEAYAGGDIVILSPIDQHERFLGYLLNSYSIAKQKERFGQGDAVVHISSGNLGQIVALIPPVREQESIASALSDVDALIESLERLIAKKRDIKRAAMQELLTGKKRLPGFESSNVYKQTEVGVIPEDWEAVPISLLAEVIMGQSPDSSNYNADGCGLPLIQGNADISNRETIKRIFTTEVTKRGRAGDIIMSVRAPVGEISRTAFDVCLGRGVCAVRPRGNPDFLYHNLIFNESKWVAISKGSTFDSVTSTDVRLFEIAVPMDEAEQSAISSILSDVDGDIIALEQRLKKTRKIKQGMMQELLTGRIRLV